MNPVLTPVLDKLSEAISPINLKDYESSSMEFTLGSNCGMTEGKRLAIHSLSFCEA